MYFNDRVTLGKTLARELQDLRGKDAVILCLKESSLLTCLTMAMELRAWVYPLLFVPVYTQDNAHVMLGAIDEEGVFCSHPAAPLNETEQLPPEALSDVEGQRQTAMATIQESRHKYEMELNKMQMNGRDLIIAGDIVTSTLPLAVAQQFLGNITPKSLAVAIGNATPAVAEQVRITADKTTVLDVISGVTSDDDRYFQHPDSYTPEQKFTITQHIATYWQ